MAMLLRCSALIDDAKLDADEVSLTASGNVLVGVAPKGFDAWSWLDEELHERWPASSRASHSATRSRSPPGRARWTTRSGRWRASSRSGRASGRRSSF